MLTIRSLVAVPSLSLRLLVEGQAAAVDAPLLWVHNTELLDPSGYLRERELVLTNGLWHNGGNAATFVHNVTRAGGAGVVYGLRDATPETPADLIAACAQAELPLLELAIEVPFTEVTQAAAAELAERRQKSLLDMVQRGTALADAISHGSGVSGVLNILRRAHRLPLAVVDRTARVLATAEATLGPETPALVADALRRHPPPLEVGLGDQERAAVFLVVVLGKVEAALLCLRPLDQLNHNEHEALTQAAHYLSLEVARTHLTQAIEARFAGELLEMVLSGTHEAELPPRFEAFGIDPRGSMFVLAAALTDRDVPADADLAASMGRFFTAGGVPAVVAEGTWDVVAIFPWSWSQEDVLEMVHRMSWHIQSQTPNARLVVGISGPALGSHQLRHPLREAREACRVLRSRPNGPPVAQFSELGTYQLLLGGEDRDTLRRLSDGVLGPVRNYDTHHRGQLETTLRTFLGHNAQLASSAADLFIHVNTLRNRLVKVAELTGRDVMTTEGRVEIFLALEADAMARAIG